MIQGIRNPSHLASDVELGDPARSSNETSSSPSTESRLQVNTATTELNDLQLEQVGVGPSETDGSQLEQVVVGPSETDGSQLEQVVVGPSETDGSQLEQVVVGPSETDGPQREQVLLENLPVESNESQPIEVVTQTKSLQSTDDNDFCLICLLPHKVKTYIIDCNHTFCYECIVTWHEPQGLPNRR